MGCVCHGAVTMQFGAPHKILFRGHWTRITHFRFKRFEIFFIWIEGTQDTSNHIQRIIFIFNYQLHLVVRKICDRQQILSWSMKLNLTAMKLQQHYLNLTFDIWQLIFNHFLKRHPTVTIYNKISIFIDYNYLYVGVRLRLLIPYATAYLVNMEVMAPLCVRAHHRLISACFPIKKDGLCQGIWKSSLATSTAAEAVANKRNTNDNLNTGPNDRAKRS